MIARDPVAASLGRYWGVRAGMALVMILTILGLVIIEVRQGGTAKRAETSNDHPAIPVEATASAPTGDRIWALRLLAQQGNAGAQNDLGTIYEMGQGVPQDFGAALKWYQLAAESGESHAQTNLGRLYAAGHGVPQNAAEAATWFRKAAEQGDSAAQTRLGVAYTKGEGVPQDYAAASKWLKLAAGQGDANAISYLAYLTSSQRSGDHAGTAPIPQP